MLPSASMSMLSDAGIFGRPGIVMTPESTTMNPLETNMIALTCWQNAACHSVRRSTAGAVDQHPVAVFFKKLAAMTLSSA